MLGFYYFNFSTGTCSDASEHVPVEIFMNEISSKFYKNITT